MLDGKARHTLNCTISIGNTNLTIWKMEYGSPILLSHFMQLLPPGLMVFLVVSNVTATGVWDLELDYTPGYVDVHRNYNTPYTSIQIQPSASPWSNEDYYGTLCLFKPN